MANLETFVRRRSPSWVELDTLVLNAGSLAGRLEAKQVRRMYLLYRSAAADLAYARREFPGERDVLRLDDLVRRASQRIYAPLPRQGFNFVAWLTTGMWQRIAERPAMLLICAAALFIPFFATATWANTNPAAAESIAPAGYSGVVDRQTANLADTPDEKFAAALEIFTHNIRIAAIVFAAGILIGIGSVAMLAMQGIMLGSMIGLTIENGNSSAILQFVFPHGFLELSCIVVAGAAGLRLGWAIVDPGYRPRAEAIGAEGIAAVQMLLVVAMTLVFCGCVEGIVSTSALPVPVGIAVGVTLFALFWGMIFWRGRSKMVVTVT